MTLARIIELLEVERECIQRASHDECDRECGSCDLVQDSDELKEMYESAIRIMKNEEKSNGKQDTEQVHEP